MSRITEDESLKDIQGRTILYRPIIIVEATDDGKQQYRLHLTELDPFLNAPTLFGILLSDLVDHISAAYATVSNRNERDLRAHIFKVMRDEDRFKEKNPSRGRARGTIIMPPRQ